MQEKFINAIQTQVTTKVSTKTKILLGLMMVACLGGMFAIAGTLNNRKTNLVSKKDIEPFFATSYCPTGKIAIGGQVNCVSQSPDGIRPTMIYSAPERSNFQNVGWIGACRGRGSINVTAICADPNQIQLYEGTFTETQHNTNDQISYQAISECPTGKIAINGEVNCMWLSPDGIRPSLVYSAPEPINFQNVGWISACKGIGSTNIKAICVDPDQLTIYNGAFAQAQHNVDNQISYQAISMCPAGKVAINGSVNCIGYSDPSFNRPTVVYSAPETSNFQNIGWIGACKGKGSIAVTAVCVDPNQLTIYNGAFAETTN